MRAIQIIAALSSLVIVAFLIIACISEARENVRNAASVLPDEEEGI